MKTIELYIDDIMANQILRPVRTKKDIILILVNSLKYLIIKQEVIESRRTGRIVLKVGKLSRIIIIHGGRIISFTFPFNLRLWGEGNYDILMNGVLIDSQITSELLLIINNNEVIEDIDLLNLFESIMEVQDSNKTWSILLSLLAFEDGYLRFEVDVDRKDHIYHPENHFDVNYSDNCTFKLGLDFQITETDFTNFIDNSQPRMYLRKFA